MIQIFFIILLFGFITSKKESGILLNNGHPIPPIGLQVSYDVEMIKPLIKSPMVIPVNDTYEAIKSAIEIGFRFFEVTGDILLSDMISAAFFESFNTANVTREDLFIAVKLPCYRNTEDDAMPKLRRDLYRLNLTYVDLWIMSSPVATGGNETVSNIDFVDTWRAMVEAQKQGLTRSIGVANFNRTQIERLITETHVTPAVLEIELNLNLQQTELLNFCKSHGIVVTAFNIFGSLVASKADDDAPPPRMDDPALVDIAIKYDKTVPQIVLRYLVELGVIPIPRSFTRMGQAECLDIFNFNLTHAEHNVLYSFDKNYRTFKMEFGMHSVYYPFT